LRVLSFAAGASLAVQPDEVLSDAELEARARAISVDIRCLVCQNQSIDDSDAPLARDLRLLVRERLVAGDSNGEVVDYLVDRYGEFVLLQPRLRRPYARPVARPLRHPGARRIRRVPVASPGGNRQFR
jgi:cytochrome c-type biogenesis protein CcmH